jgi:anti-sigma B factor antagonist
VRDPLDLDVVVDSASTLISVSGELDCHTSPRLSDLIDASVPQPPGRLLIDLSGCTFMDSAGCRTLAVALGLVPDGRLGVVCPSQNRTVARVLEIVGLADALDLRERVAGFGHPTLDDLTA